MGFGVQRTSFCVFLIMSGLLLSLAPLTWASTAPSEGIGGSSTAVIVLIIAVVLGFLFFFGGIKYVTPENVLDTETRKHLYEYIDKYPARTSGRSPGSWI